MGALQCGVCNSEGNAHREPIVIVKPLFNNETESEMNAGKDDAEEVETFGEGQEGKTDEGCEDPGQAEPPRSPRPQQVSYSL